MPALLYLPPWTVEYSYSVSPSQTRTQQEGFKRQTKRSHRSSVIAEAKRFLRLSELPYFEYFVREVCNDGQAKFTDYYADYNGLASGVVRIVEGAYSVSSDTRRHTVTCQLEIFR